MENMIQYTKSLMSSIAQKSKEQLSIFYKNDKMLEHLINENISLRKEVYEKDLKIKDYQASLDTLYAKNEALKNIAKNQGLTNKGKEPYNIGAYSQYDGSDDK